MKKLFWVFLISLLCMLALPMAANAETYRDFGQWGNGMEYSLTTDGLLTISRFGGSDGIMPDNPNFGDAPKKLCQ